MSAALQSLFHDAPARPRAPSSGFISFVVIGAAAAAVFSVGDTLAAALMADGVRSAFCFLAVLLLSYALHRFSFRTKLPHRVALPRYLAVQAMPLVLAALFGFVSGGTLALPSAALAMLVFALTAGVNFSILRNWAFAPGPVVAVPLESHS
jgi:hypothetical protein